MPFDGKRLDNPLKKLLDSLVVFKGRVSELHQQTVFFTVHHLLCGEINVDQILS